MAEVRTHMLPDLKTRNFFCLTGLMLFAAASPWAQAFPEKSAANSGIQSSGGASAPASAPINIDDVQSRLERLWNERIDVYGYLGAISLSHPPGDKDDEKLLEKISGQIKQTGSVSGNDLSALEKLRRERGHLGAAQQCQYLLRLVEIASSRHRYTDADFGKIGEIDGPIFRGHVQVQKDTHRKSDGIVVSDGEPQRGYVGLRVVNGLVDNPIQYSPCSNFKEIQRGDEVISVDDRLIAGMSAAKVEQIIDGAAGTTAELKLKRGTKIFTVRVPRPNFIPETLPEGLSARQYLELASQLREYCRFAEGRQALYRAQELDPNGSTGSLARKMLAARYPLEEPTPLAVDVYSTGFRLRMDGQFDMAESVWKHCIRRWPKFELPYRQLAAMYVSNKRPEESKRTLEQLLAINPNNARAWMVLSDVQEQQGDRSAAISSAKKAAELDPDDKYCNEWLSEISSRGAKSKGKGRK